MSAEVLARKMEQQKRVGSAEFRGTHFSYHLGAERVEKEHEGPS